MREWSFKKAVTIRTYRDYHPIPVPLNLLSQPVLALCRDSEQVNEQNEELLERKVGDMCINICFMSAHEGMKTRTRTSCNLFSHSWRVRYLSVRLSCSLKIFCLLFSFLFVCLFVFFLGGGIRLHH